MTRDSNTGDSTRDFFSMPGKPSAQTPLGPGVQIKDRYVIERELGRGGIGVVYLARDQRLHQMPVVIKFLLDVSSQSTWLAKKFMQEAEALTRIKHPGVVRVIDRDRTDDGKPFFVMEFVKGRPLRSVITSEGIDLDYAAYLIRQLGQALSAAHREGVFHRDLKPENIMLETLSDGDEQIKLIDFGIAKLRDTESGASTETGLVAGSINYMAPEQLTGERITGATDIYAFGIVAFELIAGRRPFNPDSRSQMVAMQQLMTMQRTEGFVLPQQLRPSIPDRAQMILLRALAFDAAKRPQDARQFGDELAQALDQPDASFAATHVVDTREVAQTISGAISASPTRPQAVAETQPNLDPLSAVSTGTAASRIGSSSLQQEAPVRRRPNMIAATALVLLIALGGTALWLLKANQSANKNVDGSTPIERVTPGDPAGAATVVEERSFIYSIMLQRDPTRYPGSKPSQIAGEYVFGPGDLVRLKVNSQQSGYLYVINQSPPLASGAFAYNILFPSPTSNNGSSFLSANQEVQIPEQGAGFKLDQELGSEKLWLIWSKTQLDHLDALKRWANPNDQGEIKDATETKSLAEFLTRNSTTTPDTIRNDDQKFTTVKARADLFVKLIKLEHH